MVDKKQLLSPLFLKYQADFEKNPKGRVFAPLAETYRKLGMVDKAMEILSQGIRHHPTYIMGYLGLAFCYYDLKQFNLAYSTLRPLVDTSRDNIRLQKLFAEVCLELSHREEALETLKYLLFVNPRDKEVAAQVKILERSIEEQYRPVHKPIYIPESTFSASEDQKREIPLFDIDKLENRPNANQADFDDWLALDLSREQKPFKTDEKYDFWNLKKGSESSPFKEPEIKKISESNISLNLDDEDVDDEAISVNDQNEVPLVTHTLVDLYCGQGHIEKALEVLEKILLLNPNDEKTIRKISEIKALMEPLEGLETIKHSTIIEHSPSEHEFVSFEEVEVEETVYEISPKNSKEEASSEEYGRKQLMNLIDEKIGPIELVPEDKDLNNQKRTQAIEEKLNLFLKKIQKRALDYQARV